MKSYALAIVVLLCTPLTVQAQMSAIGNAQTCPLTLPQGSGLLPNSGRKVSTRAASTQSGLSRFLAEIQSTPNLRLKSDDATIIGDPGKAVVIMELTDSQAPENQLYGYYTEINQQVTARYY